ncbi:MAG: hypothetical protein WD651_15860 [Acidimicrobiia bacterium]
MTKFRSIVVVAVTLLIVACTVQTKLHPPECNRGPPPEELEKRSEVMISLEPNPLRSGERAVLSIDVGGAMREGDAVSQSARWGCWNGVRWVGTYQVIRDIGGQTEPNRIKPGSVTTVVGIWFPVPSEYEVTIPAVPTGIYRISDETRGGVTGFVYVEVVEP